MWNPGVKQVMNKGRDKVRNTLMTSHTHTGKMIKQWIWWINWKRLCTHSHSCIHPVITSDQAEAADWSKLFTSLLRSKKQSGCENDFFYPPLSDRWDAAWARPAESTIQVQYAQLQVIFMLYSASLQRLLHSSCAASCFCILTLCWLKTLNETTSTLLMTAALLWLLIILQAVLDEAAERPGISNLLYLIL